MSKKRKSLLVDIQYLEESELGGSYISEVEDCTKKGFYDNMKLFLKDAENRENDTYFKN